LLGIRERTRLFGGTVLIDTAPGRGFDMMVSLPLNTIEQKDEPQ